MKLNTFTFLNIIAILCSCNGQSNSTKGEAENYNGHITIGDTVPAFGKNIMIVFQDKKNNYWFGSWETGLYKYDGKTIINYTTKDGLPNNRIDEIKEDASGNIYANTVNGISVFNGTQFKKLTVSNGGENQWKLEQNDIWFKSSEFSGHVFRYDGKNLYKLQIPKTSIGEVYVSKNPNNPSPYAVYCVYNDSKGNVWFGTATLGVLRYNGKSFDWISEDDVNELHDGPANGVRSIAEDRNGDFWFNSDYRYHITENKNKFYDRLNSIGSLDGKTGGNLNEYLSVALDNNKDLWFATYNDGVWKYDGKKITHYSVQVNSQDINLFYIYKDNYGNIWLGTHENGVFKFNGETFEKFNPN